MTCLGLITSLRTPYPTQRGPPLKVGLTALNNLSIVRKNLPRRGFSLLIPPQIPLTQLPVVATKTTLLPVTEPKKFYITAQLPPYPLTPYTFTSHHKRKDELSPPPLKCASRNAKRPVARKLNYPNTKISKRRNVRTTMTDNTTCEGYFIPCRLVDLAIPLPLVED